MLLFVDETENESLFLVAGLLVESREVATESYQKFKKKVHNFPIVPSHKQQVFNEFKSTLLDRTYQRIKFKMIEEINQLDCCIIYSCYLKKAGRFDKNLKELVYISLLSNIVSSIDTDTSVIFDKFNVPTFDLKIVQTISGYKNVQAIMPRDSQTEPGLQFVDNICSILRRQISAKEKNEWYKILEERIREV